MGSKTSKATASSLESWAEDVRIVQESWNEVKAANPQGLDDVGKLFYKIEFEGNPELEHTLFRGVNMAQQANKLMVMIDSAVEKLDEMAAFDAIFCDLGKRHGGYGVEDQHYPIIGAHLISTLTAGLGDAWSDRRASAWVAVYGRIEAAMKKGAHTPKGEELHREYKVKEAKRNTKVVMESWAAVKAAFDLQTVGNLFYDTLFEMHPEMPATLFKGVDKEGQAKKLMEMIDAAVGMLDGKVDELVPILKDLGERHCAYGVEDSHYGPVGAALIATLEKGLKDAFTGTVKYSWVWAYSVIENTMKEGAATEKGRQLLAEYKAKHA